MNFFAVYVLVSTILLFCIYNSSGEEMIMGRDSSDISTADYDGPYIFYRDGNKIVKQIQKDSGGFYSNNTALPFNTDEKFQVTVNDTVSFDVKLKRSINNEPCIFESPEKLAVISDIEGNFFPLRDFLLNNKIIDNNNNWIFDSGHLVLTGDMFDRGLYVTQVLWLIYKLEHEAAEAGGHVHLILGNHEIMNLNNDFRYVRNKYFENCRLMNTEYKELYTSDTELGRWLASKNIIEKIGPYIFVHGGIPQELNSFTDNLAAINNTAREYIFKSKTAKQSGDSIAKIIFTSKTSPFWYRGYIDQTAGEDLINSVLKNFAAEKIIVGHTIVDDIRYFYNGKVIGIDTDHAEGDTEGLIIDGENIYRVDKFGNRSDLK